MIAIKAHFDGKVFVPDEPIHLPPNQQVNITIERVDSTITPSPRPAAGFAKGMFIMRDDFNEPLDDFAEYE